MKKNIAIVFSWFIAVGLLVTMHWLLGQFSSQNSELRNLRADLWRQQVSMRQKQVEIARQLGSVEDATRRAVIDLIITSAREVDTLRDKNNIWNGEEELGELMKTLEQEHSHQPTPAAASNSAFQE